MPHLHGINQTTIHSKYSILLFFFISSLHVHYPPHVTVSLVSPASNNEEGVSRVLEGESARFKCSADANPGDRLARSWYVGGELLRGRTGEEMTLEGTDRSLNGREVECEAGNAIGRTRAGTRLVVSCEYH